MMEKHVRRLVDSLLGCAGLRGRAEVARGAWGLVLLTVLGLAAPAVAEERQTFAARLSELVERIATGSASESEEATRELVLRVAEPLGEAIGRLDVRSPAAQQRVRDAVQRVFATVRSRVVRASLPAKDQELFDAFAERHPQLVERLFHDNPETRAAAVQQIPLVPNSGAGVLICAKIDDWDAAVVDAAFEVADRLRDGVVVRGLTRYVGQLIDALDSGVYGAGLPAYGIVFADFAHRSILILGRAGEEAREAAPVVMRAIEYFHDTPLERYFNTGNALDALGRMRDERAAALLLNMLNERETRRVGSTEERQKIRQFVGDMALISLARIYGIAFEDLGLVKVSAPREFWGFADDEARGAAQRAFLAWHERNAGKAAAQREPFAAVRTDEE